MFVAGPGPRVCVAAEAHADTGVDVGFHQAGDEQVTEVVRGFDFVVEADSFHDPAKRCLGAGPGELCFWIDEDVFGFRRRRFKGSFHDGEGIVVEIEGFAFDVAGAGLVLDPGEAFAEIDVDLLEQAAFRGPGARVGERGRGSCGRALQRSSSSARSGRFLIGRRGSLTRTSAKGSPWAP